MSNGKTVLVVDDASLVRLYYREALESVGFQVEEALNGLEALEKAPVVQPDLMIVDVNMPHMDGMTLLETLRGQSLPLGAVPVLVTSSESADKDIAAARTAGANFYLIKPIDRQILINFAKLMSGVAP